MNNFQERDQHYLSFIKEMNDVITQNVEQEDKQTKQYMNTIISLEEKFKTILLSSKEGETVYEEFMKFILDDETEGGKGNMLSARVYFRERQETFSDEMYPAFHKSDAESLYKFKINYRFCMWALEKYKGPHHKKLSNIVAKIIPLRHVICENNLPLALNRAKLFGKNAPKNHMLWMDTVQSAAEGLMVAVDKFVPAEGKIKNNREFNGVAIGKMSLEMQDAHSQTLVKLPPKEKRILYRARKATQKSAGATLSEITDYVKESFKGATKEDIQKIEAAANGVASIDHKPDGQSSLGERFVSDTMSLEEKVENKELGGKILSVIQNLSLVERKIVLMKFGEMYGVINE